LAPSKLGPANKLEVDPIQVSTNSTVNRRKLFNAKAVSAVANATLKVPIKSMVSHSHSKKSGVAQSPKR
jgi:hypothetical protein